MISKANVFVLAFLSGATLWAHPALAQVDLRVAYVEVNNHALANVGCYTLAKDNKPFFNFASIFAANINGSGPNKPEIYFNKQVDQLLNHTNQVKELQGKGIKVLLTLLGNHKNAGWACISNENAAKTFADKIADTVVKYGLDGIDIDDEYSKCKPNGKSLILIGKALRENAKFNGKLFTKALFRDKGYFRVKYNGETLAQYLDYGWEMTYGFPNIAARLNPYLKSGMAKNKLALGISTNNNPATGVYLTKLAKKNSIGGVMVYNVGKTSGAYISKIAAAKFNQSIKIEPNCLK